MIQRYSRIGIYVFSCMPIALNNCLTLWWSLRPQSQPQSVWDHPQVFINIPSRLTLLKGQTSCTSFSGIGRGIKTLVGSRPVISAAVLYVVLQEAAHAEQWPGWGTSAESPSLQNRQVAQHGKIWTFSIALKVTYIWQKKTFMIRLEVKQKSGDHLMDTPRLMTVALPEILSEGVQMFLAVCIAVNWPSVGTSRD